MQIVEFETTVKKANTRGAGFVSIPKVLRNKFIINSQIKAILNSKIPIYAKIREFNSLGFYIPYNVVKQFSLLNNFVKVEIENIKGFYTSIGEDGRIYIPNDLAKKLYLKNNEIIEIEYLINDVKGIKYPMVNVRVKETTNEYMCLIDRKKYKSNGFFKIIRKLTYSDELNNLLEKLHHGKIDDQKSIVYSGNHKPIVVNNNISLNEIAHYLGCYFSDGTKKGVSWGICASTFEQANYYYQMHHFFIKYAKIVSNISFTDIYNTNEYELIRYLSDIWKNNVKFLTGDIKVRIIKSMCKPSLKTNKFGCLMMKENRQLTQIYYNRLLEYLFSEIKSKQNKELSIDFIFGVLEGDGSVSTHLGHLVIATNNKELRYLKEVLDIAGFNYNVRVEGENKSCIHIGLLEIIRNIDLLKDKIFKYYPKRRNLLKERLLNTASVKFLLGENKKTSNWLIGQFNEMEILDGKGNLTEFGIQIRENLKEFLR